MAEEKGKYDKVITLERLRHQDSERIGLRYKYDFALNTLSKSMGAKFSYTHGCWHVENTPASLRKIFSTFRGTAWIDQTEFFKKPSPSKKDIVTREILRVDLDEKGKHEMKCFREYLKARGNAESTIRTYSNCVGVFLTFFGGKEASEITMEEVNSFLSEHIYAQGMARSTHAQYVSSLRHFFKCRMNKHVVPEKLSYPKRGKELPKVLSKNEVKQLIRKTANLKHRTLLSVQYGMGLRVSELTGIRLRDIEPERGTIVVHGKGFKSRRVFISSKLAPLLSTYIEQFQPDHYLFRGQNGGRYSSASVNAVLKEAALRVGISRPVHSHMLRHSYATHLMDNGTDLRYIQELLGHNSSKTTEIYTFVSTKKLGDIGSPFDDLDI